MASIKVKFRKHPKGADLKNKEKLQGIMRAISCSSKATSV